MRVCDLCRKEMDIMDTSAKGPIEVPEMDLCLQCKRKIRGYVDDLLIKNLRVHGEERI